MKKYLVTIFVLLSMLLMQVGIASAAPLAGGAITLVSANASANGTVFIFEVIGNFSGSELHGSAHVEGGGDYALSCRQLDEDTVRCVASRKAQGNVLLTFGGAVFWIYVNPYVGSTAGSSGGPSEPSEYCYEVYDWEYPTPSSWVVIGINCQSSPANYGDTINIESPDWGGFWDYELMPNSPVCPFSQSGDAYYYNGCPL